MTILSQSFFPFVGSHLMSFSFLTAWHKFLLSYFLTLPFTSLTKLLDGLNEGIKCSGIPGCTFTGEVDPSEYRFDGSGGVIDGKFVGLPIDDNNESDRTDTRIKKWTDRLKVTVLS